MTKAHRLRTRKPILPLTKSIPLNFLLGCSENSLVNFELARLAAVADARKQMFALLDYMFDEGVQAGLAAWFRTITADDLKRALENPADVMMWAEEQIRRQGRAEEDLLSLPALPPGAAHLAAAVRYQERNLAEGKCAVCPKPLSNNSVRHCEEHLRLARLRYKSKNANSAEPGSIGYLHGEGFDSQQGRTPGTLQSLAIAREKKTRAILSELGLPTGSAATARHAVQAAILKFLPTSEAVAVKEYDLFAMIDIPSRQTARHALMDLLKIGKIQRIGKGVTGDAFRYFKLQ
jgi:hypothetical protein